MGPSFEGLHKLTAIITTAVVSELMVYIDRL